MAELRPAGVFQRARIGVLRVSRRQEPQLGTHYMDVFFRLHVASCLALQHTK
jgi:hypothetical protein